tara:strand:+ start:576 stop:1094 length:519 start_codon:yes stop_codon:yes gene_type:complete
MKFKAVNLKRSTGTLLMGVLALCASLAAQRNFAQEAAGSHEYSADGETTIETVNGLRVITLRDNVIVRQNNIVLTGAVAVLEYNQNNQLQQVQVTGEPAHFEQKAEQQNDVITGNSETINYYAGLESVVEFIGSANFIQPGTTLSCAQIRHTIESGATSGQACSGSLRPQSN